MFGERRGRKAFDSCDVKVVEFKDFVYKKGREGEKEITTTPSEDSRAFAGNAAVLHCPKTEDERTKIESQFTNHPTRLAALTSVRNLAGSLQCHDCRYSKMTPVEVSQDRANVDRAEADRIEASLLKAKALKELEEYQNKPELE